MIFRKAIFAVTAGVASLANASPANEAIAQAQPVLDAFHAAVIACGRQPPFKPTIRLAETADATRYEHAARAIVLVPYEILGPARRAAMERFAAIGTLGLSGQQQYSEVFNNLLVAHELGHWVQEVSGRPLTRWQAEYEANRMMVAFWRDHPAAAPAPATERRLANFVAQSPETADPMPADAGISVEAYFNANIISIEAEPARYALFQKRMVREAMLETPQPSFCQTIGAAWPKT